MTAQIQVEADVVNHPSRRPEIERLLEGHRIPWTFQPDVPVNRMSVTTDSQVRAISAPDEALVEQYAASFRDGAIFPAVLVRAGGRIVDGIHRHAGAVLAGVERLPAYVIDASDLTVLTVLAAELNQTNGVRLTDLEQRALAALWTVQGMTTREIGKRLSRNKTTVARWNREAEFLARCQRIGVKAPPRASGEVQTMLTTVHNDTTFASLVTLVDDAGLSGDNLRPIIHAIKACRSEEAEQKEVEAQRTALADEIQLRSIGLKRRKGERTKIVVPPAIAAWKNVRALTKATVEELTEVPDGRNVTVLGEGWRALAILADEVATRLGA